MRAKINLLPGNRDGRKKDLAAAEPIRELGLESRFVADLLAALGVIASLIFPAIAVGPGKSRRAAFGAFALQFSYPGCLAWYQWSGVSSTEYGKSLIDPCQYRVDRNHHSRTQRHPAKDQIDHQNM